MVKKSILLAVLAAILLAQAIFSVDKPAPNREFYKNNNYESAPAYAPGEVLVKFKKGVNIPTLDHIANSQSIQVVRYFSAISRVNGQLYALLKSKTRTTPQMQADLAKYPDVAYVSPNYILYADTTPNDPRFNELWGLHNTGQTGGLADMDIDAPEAWEKNTGSQDVIVAVIDTGIDYNHPDLAANMWVNPNEIIDGIDNDGNGYIDDIYGIDAINHSGDPIDDNGHGTHCSGTIGAAGNNNLGVVGVNWNVRLMGTKFLNSSGSGYNANAIACIDYIIDEKTTYNQDIVAINASWGGGGFDQVLKDAIDAAGTVGIVFCAAAGNSGTNNDTSPHYPSSYTSSNIIAVTAVNFIGTQYYNYGPTTVDLGAPGFSILSTTRCLYTPQPGDIFFDNMEGGGNLWTHGGALDSWGITNASSGGLENYWNNMSYGNFWSDSPGTGYVHDVNSWLAVANDIDLSSYVGQTVYLGFDGGFQFDYFRSNDTAAVEISNDGGSHWDTLVNLGPLYIGYGYYYLKQQYVIPDAYKTANFRFRFHITTDATDYSYFGYKNKGWIIDNIGIGANVTCGYGGMSGTSMATPHVTGAVALVAAEFPTETAAERITRILSHVLPLESLNGKCVTNGLLNLDLAMGGVMSTITVTSPNGGENWEAGSTHTVTWTSTGNIANVKIQYSTNNGNSLMGIVPSTPNTGNFTWIVPAAPSPDCLVKVSDVTGSASDFSDAVFTIFMKPPITITSPNGGESWKVGSSHNITWTNTGTIANVKIEYSVNKGSYWKEIVSSTINNGHYSWTIPDNTSENCLVRVSDAAGAASDTGDDLFSIYYSPSITVTSPNGGEKWLVGSAHNITWTSSGTIGNVKIEYTNNGRPWTAIVSSAPNTGKYLWTLPDNPVENCQVRVSKIGGEPSDTGDNVFSIYYLPPTITVTSPNGGEYWEVGSRHPITWSRDNITEKLNIEYSIDNGSSWENIAASIGNYYFYMWTVPNTPSSNCLVRVSETDGDSSDVSNAVFTIYSQPLIKVTSPGGGENWKVGSSHNITWVSAGTAGDVKIEYSTDSGGSWSSIIASTANIGSYNWTVPNTPSSHCLVRVSELDGNPWGVGGAVFSIYSQPFITVTYPNGGENWQIGASYNITWTGSETVGNVKIEYSTDNGSVWRTIVSSTANDGSYTWTAPDSLSSRCLVRVSETNGSLSDVSNATFSIVYPISITVISPNGGENWAVGSDHNITWKSTGTVGNVKIDYSTDDGSSWVAVTTSTGNDGSYTWTIPNTPSANCLVRIGENGGNPADVSDAVFAIVTEPQPAITVTSPNGGENLIEESTHNITWTGTGTIPKVTIEYSTDGGASWAVIVKTMENVGNYNWTVPGKSSAHCLVRIYAGDNDGAPWDVGDAVFSIEYKAYDCGFQGFVCEQKPDGSYGDRIAGVVLTFLSEDGSLTKTVATNSDGFYRISLKPQRYRVSTKHPDFQDYSTFPGFFVVTGSDGYQTGNFFLTRK